MNNKLMTIIILCALLIFAITGAFFLRGWVINFFSSGSQRVPVALEEQKDFMADNNIPQSDEIRENIDSATTTGSAPDLVIDEDMAKSLQTARDAGAQVAKRNGAGYEIIDNPLPKWDFPKKYYGKMIVFTVKSAEAGGYSYEVFLDPQTGDYRATTDAGDNFYLVDSNGIVCYGRSSYKNAYCVREKYTPLALVKYFLGQNDLKVRELSRDESELQRLMNDYGWIPDNIMAAMMAAAEISFSRLADDKLTAGIPLVWENEDGKNKNTIGTVVAVDFNGPATNLKIKGIHLTYLMADIYNAKSNPQIWDKENDTFTIPYCDMESGGSDEKIDNFFGQVGFKKENYYISQF